MSLRFALPLAVALVPVSADAATGTCDFEKPMTSATDVVQVEVLGVERPEGVGDPLRRVVCPVRAVVRKVFRGSLPVGQEIGVGVLCWSKIRDGNISVDADALAGARFLELHMTGGRPITRGTGTLILEAMTDTMVWQPQCK